MLYYTRMDLPNLFSGEGPFFFSGLTAGPTYQPSVRHSNPDTPLSEGESNQGTLYQANYYTTMLLLFFQALVALDCLFLSQRYS